jgi:hypothetical protein
MNFNFKENIKNIHQSKTIKGVLIGIITCVILLIVFTAGSSVGEHRARFAGQFGDNFERNLVGPKNERGAMDTMEGDFGKMMPGGHGAVGKILSINLPQVVVSSPDNLEKTILISTSTIIREFTQNIPNSNLKVGDSVIIIGNPNNNGQIEAKLIRIMPAR